MNQPAIAVQITVAASAGKIRLTRRSQKEAMLKHPRSMSLRMIEVIK